MELQAEKRSLSVHSRQDIVKFALEELSIGPRNSSLTASVLPDIIVSAEISGSNVTVDLHRSYRELEPDKELISRTAIAYTLTGLTFVDTVALSVNGIELKKPNGQPLGRIAADDIIFTPSAAPDSEWEIRVILQLYFADANHTELIRESRTVFASPGIPIASYIIEELIKGPNRTDLEHTIPPETSLIDVSVSDGICYVDLSRDFIARHTSLMPHETLTVYSVVNSLTAQSDIRKVQFYIEGERVEEFKSIDNFSNLFE
jgi:germination protein M